ncbi:hypothetical protein KSP35_19890 [Aquihabitans sp. G128]|nr:hypothetical protein [Aquihabitans sp. G128]QXC60558.1 hypothetical protein KSP35_19890 [Aquihabitans sp. G128]
MIDIVWLRTSADGLFELGECFVDLGPPAREVPEHGVRDPVDFPGPGSSDAPADAQGGETVSHLDCGDRGCGLCVAVEVSGIECPSFTVGADDGVGDHVVVVGERVEGSAGEVLERGNRPPGPLEGLTPHSGRGGTLLEPAERHIVSPADRAEHCLAHVGLGQQGEDAEGFLGGEGHVVADPHCWWPPPVHELDEIVPPDEPPASGATVSGEPRLVDFATLGQGRLDRVPL